MAEQLVDRRRAAKLGGAVAGTDTDDVRTDNGQSLVQLDLREFEPVDDQGELVPADSSHDAGVPHDPPEAFAQIGQNPITEVMAPMIVGSLEVIDVDHGNHQGSGVVAGEERRSVFEEAATVENTGQGVDARSASDVLVGSGE